MEHAILHDISRDEEIAELRAEVARLREIAFGVEKDLQVRLAVRFGLTPAEAWVLTILYQRRGGVLTFEQMIEGMPGHPDSIRGPNSCAVAVHRIRKKLQRDDVITTARGVGYVMQLDAINWLESTLC